MIVPEEGTWKTDGDCAGVVSEEFPFGLGALAAIRDTVAGSNPARAILSLASARERPTKFGMTYSGVFGGCPNKRLTFGEVNSVAPAAGTWEIT